MGEYVAGDTLHNVIKHVGKLPRSLASIYTEQMLRGLAFMHDQNVIHRDLKPANVMVTTDGDLKLVDFGAAFDIARLTRTVEQTIIGTPAYIAPEVYRRSKHTTKTDIWSLGVTVYEMVTGKTPFESCDTQQLFVQVNTEIAQVEYHKGFPEQAREFIEACLAFHPEDRPSAKDLLRYEFIMSSSEREMMLYPEHSIASPPENEGTVRLDIAVVGELSWS